MSIPFHLAVPREVLQAVVAHARTEQPNECCGLLAGRLETDEGSVRVGRVVTCYPLVNALQSPVSYAGEPRGLFLAHKDMRARGLVELAVYHSHPTSPPVPSATDLRQWAHGPEVVCLIVSLTTEPPTVRGWWLSEAGFTEAPLSEPEG